MRFNKIPIGKIFTTRNKDFTLIVGVKISPEQAVNLYTQQTVSIHWNKSCDLYTNTSIGGEIGQDPDGTPILIHNLAGTEVLAEHFIVTHSTSFLENQVTRPVAVKDKGKEERGKILLEELHRNLHKAGMLCEAAQAVLSEE